MITRVPVTSSSINSIGHDPSSNTMEVEFKDGSVYTYHDVPKDAHDRLFGAKSIGGHFHANVKNNYKYTK
jgi:hypothetical protein